MSFKAHYKCCIRKHTPQNKEKQRQREPVKAETLSSVGFNATQEERHDTLSFRPANGYQTVLKIDIYLLDDVTNES